MEDISTLVSDIKNVLQEISFITPETIQDDNHIKEISYGENPLNPNLLAYCFDIILGFKVQYRIAEKVNYIIEFDYKGTYAVAKHFKMSYRLFIDEKYASEVIKMFSTVKLLLEKLFIAYSKDALLNNEFSLRNEACEYFSKLSFYEQRIEVLNSRKLIIKDKLKGQYDISEETPGYKHYSPKGKKYLNSLHNEIIYDIEAYIDTFYSALEHLLTLLYPFADGFPFSESYYEKYIGNPKWTWMKKIRDVCGAAITNELLENLKGIKEVYRNHKAHGSFSREMMAYVYVPDFGRYPLFIGKKYLKGFTSEVPIELSYDVYLSAKSTFTEVWEIINKQFPLPMTFINSDIPIPIKTMEYTSKVETVEDAEMFIEKLWYDIDNQSNMDW